MLPDPQNAYRDLQSTEHFFVKDRRLPNTETLDYPDISHVQNVNYPDIPQHSSDDEDDTRQLENNYEIYSGKLENYNDSPPRQLENDYDTLMHDPETNRHLSSTARGRSLPFVDALVPAAYASNQNEELHLSPIYPSDLRSSSKRMQLPVPHLSDGMCFSMF